MDNDLLPVNTSLNMAQELAAMDIGRDYTMADWKYEKLKEQIEEFQENLSDAVDVCIQLAVNSGVRAPLARSFSTTVTEK